MLDEFRFNALIDSRLPAAATEVLVFVHDKWRGYDEIMQANFDGKKFYHQNGREMHAQFIAGWLELPIKLSYGSSKSILP